MDWQHTQITAFNRGKLEGELKGKLEGKAEGILEGEARGKRETAYSMLSAGMVPDMISKFTGLSVEEIQDLRTQN
jgi:predicted transposase/invertase (TIGR01784 family)